MRKTVYIIVLIMSMVAIFSSCRGFRSAPPCPAYSSAEVITTNNNSSLN